MADAAADELHGRKLASRRGQAPPRDGVGVPRDGNRACPAQELAGQRYAEYVSFGGAPVAVAHYGLLSTAQGARRGPDLSSGARPTPGIRLAADTADLPGRLGSRRGFRRAAEYTPRSQAVDGDRCGGLGRVARGARGAGRFQASPPASRGAYARAVAAGAARLAAAGGAPPLAGPGFLCRAGRLGGLRGPWPEGLHADRPYLRAVHRGRSSGSQVVAAGPGRSRGRGRGNGARPGPG